MQIPSNQKLLFCGAIDPALRPNYHWFTLYRDWLLRQLRQSRWIPSLLPSATYPFPALPNSRSVRVLTQLVHRQLSGYDSSAECRYHLTRSCFLAELWIQPRGRIFSAISDLYVTIGGPTYNIPFPYKVRSAHVSWLLRLWRIYCRNQ